MLICEVTSRLFVEKCFIMFRVSHYIGGVVLQVELGKTLRLYRKSQGWNQQFIADQLNIDRSTYSYYESGRTSPSIDSLIRLSKIFNVSIEELLNIQHDTPVVAENPPPYEPIPQLELTQQERARILKIRQLDNESREMIDELINERLKNLD